MKTSENITSPSYESINEISPLELKEHRSMATNPIPEDPITDELGW
jgi:hypothetical protein